MCGVAGYINIDVSPASAVILKKMTDAVAHRGPDGEGQWVEGHVGIGHRRLAILDLTPAGHQPMASADHRWVLSYNGEVYNYRELRANLEAEGVWFRSQTDTEVVLYALATWGTDALLKFNGMFALALWDRKEQTLLLARDRYGIKPIYYSQQGNVFSFGSEQKAIIAQPGFRKVLNKPALLEYFTFQNIFTDQTLLQDIKILPAGHFITLSTRCPEPRLNQYWNYHFREPERSLKKEEYIEELDRLFRQAVSRQLVSDVELGAYLSGGMDSGSITALAAQQIPHLKTFTCGFDLSSASGIELAFDERKKAEAMSAGFKTEHYEIVLKAGDMERCLPKLVWHLEEPRVGQSYPNYYAAKLASKFVKVVLSGCGGDEMFGGYPWRYNQNEKLNNFNEFVETAFPQWQRLASQKEIIAMFRPILNEVSGLQPKNIFRKVFLDFNSDLSQQDATINLSLHFEAKTFLHGLFIVEDKLSMAHGLEARVPFMDNDLVEFACRLPAELKVKNKQATLGKNKIKKGVQGKIILRALMSKYLPEDIIRSPKQGFSSPDASWFKGSSIDYLKKTVLSRKADIYKILDYQAVKPVLDRHFQGKENKRLFIWSLLSVNEYFKQTF